MIGDEPTGFQVLDAFVAPFPPIASTRRSFA